MDSLLGVLNGFAALAEPMTFVAMVIGFLIGTFFAARARLDVGPRHRPAAAADLQPGRRRRAGDVRVDLHGRLYAGSITAITINIPGAPANMMTASRGTL